MGSWKGKGTQTEVTGRHACWARDTPLQAHCELLRSIVFYLF